MDALPIIIRVKEKVLSRGPWWTSSYCMNGHSDCDCIPCAWSSRGSTRKEAQSIPSGRGNLRGHASGVEVVEAVVGWGRDGHEQGRVSCIPTLQNPTAKGCSELNILVRCLSVDQTLFRVRTVTAVLLASCYTGGWILDIPFALDQADGLAVLFQRINRENI